jgi:hypothetical protein
MFSVSLVLINPLAPPIRHQYLAAMLVLPEQGVYILVYLPYIAYEASSVEG